MPGPGDRAPPGPSAPPKTPTEAAQLRRMAEAEQAAAFGARRTLARTPPPSPAPGLPSITGLQPIRAPLDAGTPQESSKRTHAELTPDSAGEADKRPRTQHSDSEAEEDGSEPTEELEARPEEEAHRSPECPAVLQARVSEAVLGITGAARSKSSKLNKDEIAVIGDNCARVMAAVAALSGLLAEARLENARLTERLASSRSSAAAAVAAASAAAKATAPVAAPCTSSAPSYASALKLQPSRPPMAIPEKDRSGPVLAIYPEDEAGITSAQGTKDLIKRTVDPSKINVQVEKVRMVANAGVVIQTGSQAQADRLRSAMPATLRVTEPKKRLPLVALNRLEGDPAYDVVVAHLQEQNFEGSQWTLEKLKTSCRLAFKKGKMGGDTTVVLECAPSLRDALVEKGRVFIGWQAVTVTDHINVTCCMKCQQFGHPERYCRQKEVTCGRCGEIGHASKDCKAEFTRCATCKKFGKKDSETHRTGSQECPARQHAESRMVQMTSYHG